jgi:hypothetical protein
MTKNTELYQTLTVTENPMMPGLLSPGNGQEAEDRLSLISMKPVNPSPDTLTSSYFKPYPNT